MRLKSQVLPVRHAHRCQLVWRPWHKAAAVGAEQPTTSIASITTARRCSRSIIRRSPSARSIKSRCKC